MSIVPVPVLVVGVGGGGVGVACLFEKANAPAASSSRRSGF